MNKKRIKNLVKLNKEKNWGWRELNPEEIKIAESIKEDENISFFFGGNSEDGYFVADREMKYILQGFKDEKEAEYFYLICRVDSVNSKEALTEILKREYDQGKKKDELFLINTRWGKWRQK